MGNTPNIRFKGFTDDWEQRKLGDNIIEYTEKTTINNQYPVLTSSRKGIFFQTEYYDGNQVASADNTGYNIVPYGYFTYRHMSDDEIFHFNINDIAENGIVSTLYPVFTTDENLDSRYLQYQLNYGREFAKYAILQKQGGSRTYMYLNKLKNLYLIVPKSVNEQKRISGYFMQLDNLITLHQRKCDETKKLKKFMLQKMFPKKDEKKPEIRFADFTDDWEQRKLGEFCNIVTGKLDANAMVEGGRYDFYTSGIQKYKIDTAAFEGPAITIAGNGATVGYMHLADGLFNAYQRTYVLSDFSADRQYLYSEIGRELPKKIAAEARTGNIPYIVMNMLTDLEISVPIAEEQQKIGKYFGQLDFLITLHQRKCDEIKEIKKFMLQNMFPQKG